MSKTKDMVIDQRNKQQTIQYLTDLMGVIQNAYYKRGLFMPLEYDSNSRVRGDLRVHEGSDSGISIDLYNFEGDGKPVCDGLKPCTITYDDGSHDTGHLFCMHYDPDDVTPLVFLLSHDEYGDGGDIDVEPESVPADVLENIVKWLEGVFEDSSKFKIGDTVLCHSCERCKVEKRSRDKEYFSGVITKIDGRVVTVRNKKGHNMHYDVCCLEKLTSNEKK